MRQTLKVPFDISCGCRLLVWLFLRIDFLGKPESITDWNMSLCILPALKAAEIAKFIALPRGGDSHMKQTGMLVGNFEFNP